MGLTRRPLVSHKFTALYDSQGLLAWKGMINV
jgi:hypothetical protein